MTAKELLGVFVILTILFPPIGLAIVGLLIVGGLLAFTLILIVAAVRAVFGFF